MLGRGGGREPRLGGLRGAVTLRGRAESRLGVERRTWGVTGGGGSSTELRGVACIGRRMRMALTERRKLQQGRFGNQKQNSGSSRINMRLLSDTGVQPQVERIKSVFWGKVGVRI